MPFDRDKLMRSVQVALRKRAVDPDRVERMVNGIVRQLESTGESEVTSEQIGHLVMEGLRGLDDGRLCALRLGLSEFPRGQGFRDLRRRAVRRADRRARRELSRAWPRARKPSRYRRRSRARSPPDGGGAAPRPPQSRPDLAQSGRRRADRAHATSGEPVVVGRGWTAVGGRPHAETVALAEAGEAARGATAYVTLEPCAHEGETPPCADALIAAGVAPRRHRASPIPIRGSTVAAMRSSTPPASRVTTDVLADEAARAHAGHISRVTKGRPHVTLKLAVSADGMIGRRDGERMIITGRAAFDAVQAMRAESDAVMIGIGTALVDDPRLTVRLPGMAERSPVRIILDAAARLPLDSHLVTSARETPLIARRRAGGAGRAQGRAPRGGRRASDRGRRRLGRRRPRRGAAQRSATRASPASSSKAAPRSPPRSSPAILLDEVVLFRARWWSGPTACAPSPATPSRRSSAARATARSRPRWSATTRCAAICERPERCSPASSATSAR